MFAIVAHLKQSGVSFNATLELLSDHVPYWPDEHGDDDGKFVGGELERHVGLAWSKLPPHIPAEHDFDDLEPADLATGLVARTSTEVTPTYHRGLTIRNRRAVDDYKNAKAGIFRQGLRPAYNELKQSVSFVGDLNWDESYGRDLTEPTARMVRDLLIEAYQGADFQPSKENVYEAILSLSYENKFHPVVDYLNGLEWDGIPRCQDLFALGFPCVDDPQYLRECGVRFMISAVARAREPGCKVDTMPVVCSTQGSLKSTGVRVLFGADWSSDAAIPDLKSKDAAMLLRGTWCYEYAELAGMGNQDVATLKAFLSRAVDTFRPPYAKAPEDNPRRCVFFGTVNETGYLRDPTGGRRFWPMEMAEGSRVDVDWIAANRDQLWAEADARFAREEQWWLEDEVWEMATERAAAETVEDPWADLIRAHLVDRLAEPHFDEEPVPSEARIATTELLRAVGCGGGRARSSEGKRLRRIMEHEVGGWRYRRGLRAGDQTFTGYYLVDAPENAGLFGR
ncbi:MAG: virulence-associated E family protein [Pseudomonadota bacterium]